jgi:NAD(P)-dependent dehydrogenase (short-subunit alcohol dehydrogenase family)
MTEDQGERVRTEEKELIDLSLQDKVAIVTGGSKGIGRSIAKLFAAAGAAVAVAARGRDDLERTAKEIEADGGRALAIPTDVTEPEQVNALVDAVVQEFGTVDILVNNAGAAPFYAPLDQVHLDGFEKYFKANFSSALYCTQAVAPILVGKKAGCVLNVVSVSAFVASPGLSYYSTAKAALVNLTRTTAQEWAGRGVRVNALAPGWIKTEMNEAVRQNKAFLLSRTKSIPLGRWGEPEEVAGAALFLCSPAASWMTGAVLLLDGGQLLNSVMPL